MIKKIQWTLALTTIVSLFACSDNGLDSEEALAENWPADFNTAEYAQVNPDIVNYQRINAVEEKNEQYLVALRKRYADSLMTTGADSATAAGKASALTVSFADPAEQAIFFDDSVAVKKIFTDYAFMEEKYWPGMSALKEGVVSGEGGVNLSGVAAMEYRAVFEKFHCLGNKASQDLTFLQSVKIDSTLIHQQYVLAGIYEGRAYRFCHEGEASYPKFIIDSKKELILDTTWDFKADTTKVLDSALLPSPKLVLDNGDTVDARGFEEHPEDFEGVAVTDTIKYGAPVERDSITYSDSTMTVDSLYATTKVYTPVSANARDVNAGRSNENLVWDFSADRYCKNKADGNIYIIVQ